MTVYLRLKHLKHKHRDNCARPQKLTVEALHQGEAHGLGSKVGKIAHGVYHALGNPSSTLRHALCNVRYHVDGVYHLNPQILRVVTRGK